MKSSIYETITRQIVEAIEQGAGTFNMPWHRSRSDVAAPYNAQSGRSYRGLNIITLWMTAEARGYGSGVWGTFQQWKEKGASVRKGEKATKVFFWKKLVAAEQQETDEEGNGARFVARAYSVFNADQIEGYEAPAIVPLSESERIEAAERFFRAIPASVAKAGRTPCYHPATDTIEMGPFENFKSAVGYYAVLAHEMIHWTAPRLDRDLSGRFGSEAYAMEELVAELGAAFTIANIGIPSEPRRDHAPYIDSWLKVLKADSRAIFTAASKAQAAADYLAGFSAEVDQAHVA